MSVRIRPACVLKIGAVLAFFSAFSFICNEFEHPLFLYNMKIHPWLLLLFLTIGLPALAQDYMFKHLEAKDGLSNNQVTAIHRDTKGFMWFGTASGLNRYDGYEVKVYRNQSGNPNSLPDNYVEGIQKDRKGRLWIRTGSGYSIYCPDTDSFDNDLEGKLWKAGISGNLSRIFIDREKTYWAYVAGEGLYRYRSGEEEAVIVPVPAERPGEAGIMNMAECADGILLIYWNGLLTCVDKQDLSVKWTTDGITRDVGEEQHNSYDLFADREGRIWIYGVVGTWVYQPAANQWLVRSLRNDNFDVVRAVAQDKYGRIWVGHDQNGIRIVEDGKTFRVLKNDPDNQRSLPNNTVTALYEDEEGTMWVGLYKKGLSYYNESIFKFGMYDVGDVNCVEEGDDGAVWLGMNGTGLVRWDMRTGERRTFAGGHGGQSVSSDVVVSLLRDSRGRLWIGTYWGGLNCYDGTRFVHYRHEPGKQNTLASDNVWSLAEDRDGNIWIGTLGGGLQCLNPATSVFTTYTTGNSGLLSDYVMSICLAGDDRMLMIGTSYGMSVMDMATRRITEFATGATGEKCFASLNITQVYEDSRGYLWTATREGLKVYDSRLGRSYDVPLNPDDTKPFVLGIVEDSDQNIWVTVGGELVNVVLTDAGGEELSFHCRSYTDKDGLQSSDFNQRSMKRLGTGEILVGGMYGVNSFRPNNIKYNLALPKVMFCGLRLFNEEIGVGGVYGGRVVLDKALNETEELVLDYKQNVFTVSFASDNYVLPEKTSYAYMLEGFDEDWLTGLPDMRQLTYTNLAPGSYVLRVKAVNSDGYAGTEEARLKIVIRPPFWLTPWAYACYAVLVAGSLFCGLIAVKRRERNKWRMRQIEEDARRTEELNQMKFRFFTNVSHELRTPLTLIISPLESMIKEADDEKKAGKLKMMHRNALRLLHLVNQLLDFRKNEMAGLHLNLSEGDIVPYIHNICNSFLMLSDKKDVRLTFFSAIDSLEMSFDEDKVGKIVMNLLSNAFKFTPAGGKVDVSLEVLEGSPETLEIKIADTGIGIKDEDKQHVFERFYQAGQEGGATASGGSGIGLSLVHDYVALHGGAVQVFDNAGGGSVFVVDLPVKHSAVSVATPLSAEAAEEDALALDGAQSSSEKADEGDGKKPVVLVVDDSGDFLAFMSDSLSLYFTVRVATNGEEALKMIPEVKPDLIVSDLMMPVMDGNELCRRVKADKKTADIPFVLLTAKQSVENKVEGLTIGADDYVTKPFNMEVLVLRMRKLIDLSSRHRSHGYIDPEPSEIVITSLDEKLIGDAIKYVEKNIARSDLSVEELSHELGMSRAHLYKKLLQITGKTPIEFIRVIRLKRAAQLLRESQQNVSEIAYQLGFNNPKYFSKYFKDEFGVLPSVYQEREGK